MKIIDFLDINKITLSVYKSHFIDFLYKSKCLMVRMIFGRDYLVENNNDNS